MSSLNKIRILENDEQKKTNPNSNEAFELGFVDSLGADSCQLFPYAVFSSLDSIFNCIYNRIEQSVANFLHNIDPMNIIWK